MGEQRRKWDDGEDNSLPTHPHAHPLRSEIAVELLRFFTVFQSPFVQLASFAVNKCNLLEARVIVTSYNQHVRLLSPEPFGWFAPPKSTRAWSRHCYGIISPTTQSRLSLSAHPWIYSVDRVKRFHS